MRTTLQESGDNSLQHLQFGTQIYSYASSNEDTRSKSSRGHGMGKLGEDPCAWNITKVRSTESEVVDDARMSGS